jgi:predicted lipopolysaccharide heptosyltransferase III
LRPFPIHKVNLNLPEFRNVLLIQLGDVGDVVLTSPSIRAVKETYPEARVSVLVSRPYGCLLGADPNVHDVVEISRIRGSVFARLREHLAFARKLRQTRYDLVIDLRTGDRGAILSLLTGAKIRIGRPGTKNQFWHRFAYTNTLQDLVAAPPPAHPGADQSLRILRGIGINTSDTLPRLFISPQNRSSAEVLLKEYGLVPESLWVTINPFSRWKYKEWDPVKWGRVIDWLWEIHRIPSVLIGSQEEAVAGQEIIKEREGHTFNLAGKTTLGELAALISMSSLHMGVDSAAPHMAAALNTPTITIHGPSDWRAWRTVDELHRIITPAMECVPCSRMGCDDSGASQCLEQLPAETVIGVVEEILQNLLTLKQGKPHLQ